MNITAIDQATLGGIYLLIFFALIIGVSIFILVKVAPWWHARQRDQQIEVAMRLGMRDAKAQQRIADKLMREREE